MHKGYWQCRLYFLSFASELLHSVKKISKPHDLFYFTSCYICILGTSILYQPGLLVGGNIEHECNTQRSIGYYLEGLTCLAPFTKKPIHAALKGVTNDQIDPSVSWMGMICFSCTIFSSEYSVVIQQRKCIMVKCVNKII